MVAQEVDEEPYESYWQPLWWHVLFSKRQLYYIFPCRGRHSSVDGRSISNDEQRSENWAERGAFLHELSGSKGLIAWSSPKMYSPDIYFFLVPKDLMEVTVSYEWRQSWWFIRSSGIAKRGGGRQSTKFCRGSHCSVQGPPLQAILCRFCCPLVWNGSRGAGEGPLAWCFIEPLAWCFAPLLAMTLIGRIPHIDVIN